MIAAVSAQALFILIQKHRFSVRNDSHLSGMEDQVGNELATLPSMSINSSTPQILV
jgi:hypothetical protein